jgi:plastocyanin
MGGIMRKARLAALMLVLPALLVVAAPALSREKSVEVDDNYFVHKGTPKTVTVKKGDTVAWEWEGRNPHNVTVTRGPVKFHSKTKTSGSYSKRLTQRGTYRILCTIHAPTMRMKLKVE